MLARLDGATLKGTSTEGVVTYELDVAPAEHQLVVSLDGEPVFASWLTVAAAASGSPLVTTPIRVGDDSACSTSGLAGATRDASGRVRAPGVMCDHWVAAVATERRGAVLVARCARSACGSFVEWRAEGSVEGGGVGSGRTPGEQTGPRTPLPQSHGWPAWATWTTVGIGAVAATTLTLIATGVFESRTTEQRFVAGGVRVE
jgi:hypothetical protein